MPIFTYQVAGQTATVTVPDELADWHRAQGHVEVDASDSAVDQRATVEGFVDELKGPVLDAALEAAKVAHPSGMKADEKRAALADTLAPTPEEK